MHAEAAQYVNRFAHAEPITVVEIGSLNINGTVRSLFPAASWHGIDVVDGPDVDEVADGATFVPGQPVDLVVCCEVLEHTEAWRDIVTNTANMLKPGGRVILTAAGPDRLPHSAVDGGRLRDGEYYANISADELTEALESAGFVDVAVEIVGRDVRGTGVTPKQAPKRRKQSGGD